MLFVREAIPNKQKVKYKVLNKGSLGESSHFYDFPQATTMSQRSKVKYKDKDSVHSVMDNQATTASSTAIHPLVQ